MASFKKWDDDIVIGLLAWLDICKKRKLDFEDTILEHLKHISKSYHGEEYDFTIAAVKTKLLRLQSLHSERLSANQILAKGFPEFVAQHNQALKEATSCYEKTMRSEGKEVQNLLNESSSSTSSVSVQELSYPGTAMTLHKEKQIGGGPPRDQITRNTNSSAQDHPREEVISKSSEPAARFSTEKLQIHMGQSSSKATSGGHTKIQDEISNGKEVEKLRAALRQKDEYIRNLRVQWNTEADSFHIEETRLKAVEANLRAEISCLKAAQEQRNKAGKDPLEEKLYERNFDVWDLTERLTKMRKLHSFTAEDSLHSKQIDSKSVDKILDEVADDLELILNDHDMTQPLHTSQIEENSDLACLVRALFTHTLDSNSLTTRLKQSAAKCGTGLVVRSLCMAAVGQWVFASDFPNFARNQSRLLQAYRDAVMGHDGWSRLRNLDLAAHHILIRDEHFNKTLTSRKAEDFASRLSRALATLFPGGLQHQAFENWGEPEKVWQERKFRITEIFKGALKLKAETVLHDQVFDFVVHPPEDAERNRISRIQDNADCNLRTPHRLDQQDFHILASFHIYGRPNASLPRNLMADALVQTRNFLDKASFTRTDKPIHTKTIRVQNFDVCTPTQSKEVSPTSKAQPENLEPRQERNSSIPQLAEAMQRASREGSNETEPNGDTDLQFQRKMTSRQYKLKASLQQHIAQEECAYCPDCNTPFVQLVDLRRHQKTEHDTPNEVDDEQRKRRSSATDCNRDTHSLESPRKRKRAYQRRFKCEDCDREFYHRNALEKHRRADHRSRAESQTVKIEASNPPEDATEATETTRNAPVKDTQTKSASEISEEKLKDGYKCSVCAAVFPSADGRDEHFHKHPLCLQTNKGHLIDQSTLEPGQELAACQICFKLGEIPTRWKTIEDDSRQTDAAEGGESLDKLPSDDRQEEGKPVLSRRSLAINKCQTKANMKRDEREHSEFQP